ncbi:MAG: hypothetical protein Ct9H300mP23_02860 [Nitrospinota bacterium]|nr:MAG: hypothetical protein Ct9H300mP23_02860 [Nitrospinota bacterium]
MLVTESLQDAVDMANKIAPEHLDFPWKTRRSGLKKCKMRGCISGTLHPGSYRGLPSRPQSCFTHEWYGTVLVSSRGIRFCQASQLISYTREALQNCGKTVTLLAEMEDLGGHANSVKLRLGGPEKKS